MNPAEIKALIDDLMSRSTDAVNRGNQDAADIYEVAARVVREHADEAQRKSAAVIARHDKRIRAVIAKGHRSPGR